MAVENCTISNFDYYAQLGSTIQAGVVNLTVTPNDGFLIQASDLIIGGAFMTGLNEWTGGNVTSGVTKVVFSNNGDGTVNAAVHHDDLLVTNIFPGLNVDIDNTKVARIFGCTDPTALNYNSNANVDNGTCTYEQEVVKGCTDPTAINYNPLATSDDGSCEYLDHDPIEDLQEFRVTLHLIKGRSLFYNEGGYPEHRHQKLFTVGGAIMGADLDNEDININGTMYSPNNGKINPNEIASADSFGGFLDDPDFQNQYIPGFPTSPTADVATIIANGNWQMNYGVDNQRFTQVEYRAKEGYYYPFPFEVSIPPLIDESLELQGGKNVFEYEIEYFYWPTGEISGVNVYLQHYPPLENPAIPNDVPSDWPVEGGLSSNYGGGPLIIIDQKQNVRAMLVEDTDEDYVHGTII